MDKYDLLKSMNGIDDAAISDKPRSRRTVLFRVAAAAACLALFVSAVFFYRQDDGNTMIIPNHKKAMLLAAPEVPKQAQRPNSIMYGNNWNKFIEDEKIWRQEQNQRIQSVPTELNTLNPFWINLQEQFLTNSQEENPLISPLNIYFALSMLAEVTEGESRQQVLDVLNVADMETLRTQAMGLWKSNVIDDGISTVELGNSLWLSNDYSYNNTAISNLAKYHFASTYSGQMGSDQYNKTLQNWINAKTHNLLAEQAQKQAFTDETIFALVSSLYLKANWCDQFSEKKTTEDIFHAASGDKTVSFLRADHMMAYCYTDDMSAVALPLESGGAMWFFLPDEGVELSTILQQNLCDVARNPDKYLTFSFTLTHISIPKFDVSTSISLIDGLTAMGIRDVFDRSLADFSPLTNRNGSFINSADHAARIRIDEEGCEAAAFTVLENAGAAPPEGEAYFYADRPFAFVVTGIGDVPLFAGVINNP